MSKRATSSRPGPACPCLSLAIAAFCGILGGCGEVEPGPADVVADVGPEPARFGERCGTTLPCSADLLCMTSEYAPGSWCTRACATSLVGNHCSDGELGTPAASGPHGFCVQMPGGWNGPAHPFCVPQCNNVAECPGGAATWESCEKPQYKNTPLLPSLPTRTCQSPSAHGQITVDPVTCDWMDKVKDPKVTAAKQECIAYCKFLATCKLSDPKTEKVDCCTWRCFQRLTPNGNIDNKLLAETKCYVKSFNAYAGTNMVCSGYKSDCGPVPP